MTRAHFTFCAFAVAGALAIGSQARAASRQLAPGGALIPRFDPATSVDDRSFWRSPLAAYSQVGGLSTSTAYAFGRITIPVDSTFIASPVVKLRAFGGQSGTSQMCFFAYTVTSGGLISTFTGSQCTSGATATNQLLPQTVSIASNDQAIVMEIAGQNGSIAKWLQVQY